MRPFPSTMQDLIMVLELSTVDDDRLDDYFDDDLYFKESGFRDEENID